MIRNDISTVFPDLFVLSTSTSKVLFPQCITYYTSRMKVDLNSDFTSETINWLSIRKTSKYLTSEDKLISHLCIECKYR